MKKIIILILILSINTIFASPGDLDTQFGKNGKVVTNINDYDNFVRGVVTTEDGSTILAGTSESGTITNITLTKYDYDGKLDQYFGLSGIVNVDFNQKISINAVAITPNDQLYVVGSIQNTIYTDFFIVKFTRNGKIDSTFGTNGSSILDLQHKDDVAFGIALQNDGRIVVVGRSNNGTDDDAAIIKLKTNGTLDSTFADNGISINALAAGLSATSEAFNGVSIQSDGRIIACGYTQIALRNLFLVTRILPNGTLDYQFGINSDGIIKMSIGSSNDIAYGVNIQEDSKILIYGTSYKGVNPKFALLRLLSYGRVDSELYGSGMFVSDYGKANSTGRSAYLQSDNSIIVAGENYNTGGIKEFAMARIYYDGSFDPNFGINGKTSTTFNANDNSAYALGFITNGKLLLAGDVFNGANFDFGLARYDIGSLPRVRTKPAFEIRSTTAFAGGTILNDGVAKVKVSGLVWDTLEFPDIYTNAGLTNNGSKSGTYFNQMTGLLPGTVYYVRAYVTNALGTTYGYPEIFTTLDGAKLTTNEVSNIKKATAVCGGEIISDGGVPILKRGVVWDSVPYPTINRKIGQTDNGTGKGTFVSQLTGLNLKTLYYVRAYATNEINTNYGNQSTFTSPDFPVVTTTPLITVNDFTFLAGGNVLSDGGASVTKRGVVYNNKPNPNLTNRIGLMYVDSGLGKFSTTISGFFPDSTYYLKAFAINEAGTVYGDEISFRIYNGPGVTTSEITDIDSRTANSGGNISTGGSFNVTQRGVIWSLFPNPSLSTYIGFTKDGTGSGTFSSKVTPIDPETFYYLRAYSIYNLIYGYGKEFTFWTLSLEPKSYPNNYKIAKTADGQLTITFDPAKSIQDCDGYLITQSINKLPDFTPKDGNGYKKGITINSTKIVDVISNSDAFNSVIDSLTLDSNYYYSIFPFNYNGSVDATMNYKTDGNVPILYRQMTTEVENENNKNLDLFVYINFNDLKIKTNFSIPNCNISIINEIGLQLLQIKFENNSNEFNIKLPNEFVSGVYFVKFEFNNQVIFKKFTFLK